MIKVTLEFANQAELLAYFSAPVAEKVAITAIKPGVALESGESTPAAEVNKPVPKKAAVSSSVAASPTVDYPTLQKAVFALANASRDAASEVAASFKVKTFKELSQDQWAPALTAVNLKLESLKAAA